mmetsp:Transcript_38105/g.91930  ORF Transcript_38105/g.91930 Transcript_38105/m.91930 type:complete len:213 (+) Transcript_38105:529-1167(+)
MFPSSMDCSDCISFFSLPVPIENSSSFSSALFAGALHASSLTSAMDSNDSNAFFPAPTVVAIDASSSLALPPLPSPPPAMDSNDSSAFFPAPVSNDASSSSLSSLFAPLSSVASPPAMDGNDNGAFLPSPITVDISSSFPAEFVVASTSSAFDLPIRGRPARFDPCFFLGGSAPKDGARSSPVPDRILSISLSPPSRRDATERRSSKGSRSA